LTPFLWFLWGVTLVIQNASFTTVSRARNSGSYWYHFIASWFSNGIWFAQMFFVFNVMDTVREAVGSGGIMFGIKAGIFYTIFTAVGSVSTHYVLRTYVEKGKRKVGA